MASLMDRRSRPNTVIRRCLDQPTEIFRLVLARQRSFESLAITGFDCHRDRPALAENPSSGRSPDQNRARPRSL
jgi:hypothetical protein